MNPSIDSNSIDVILMIAWSVWKNRNELRHGDGGMKQTPAEMCMKAISLLMENQAAQQSTLDSRQ